MPQSSRTVRPTDLVALVSYDGKVYRNEARTWDNLEKVEDAPSPIDSAFDVIEPLFSFATGRQTWINVSGLTLQGLISARRLHARHCWEIDTLICATPEQEAVCLDLLESMVRGAGKASAQKVFLRLLSDSPLAPYARKTGFVPYTRELVYFRGSRPEQIEEAAVLRKATQRDDSALFRLYNRNVPELVRRHEALTLQEWQARRQDARLRGEFVEEREGQIVAWARLGTAGGYSHISALHELDGDGLERVLSAMFARVGGRRIYVSVPQYDFTLQQTLEDLGFGRMGEHSVFVHRTLRLVGELAEEKRLASRAVPA
jgi:hypothetical protein